MGGTYQSWDGSAYQTVQVADLELTYSGSLSNQSWVSLVDHTLNTISQGTVSSAPQPCDSGSVAAHTAGSAYSGVLPAPASSKVVTVDTLQMSTTLTFAVCYAEVDGTSSDSTWADSGIRLTVSKIDYILYNDGLPFNPKPLDNMKGYWKMGDGGIVGNPIATFPTIVDETGNNNGTMTNMTSTDFVADVPE